MRIALFLTAALLAGISVPAWGAGIYGTNLVVNGDAEDGVGAPSSSVIVVPKAWSTTGQFSLVQYGASGGFPDKTTPGPTDRGKNLFEGGNVAKSTAAQTIDFKAAAADIAAGKVHYTFSAWIGGYASQEDSATVSVVFRDANGSTLGQATLGPVSAAQRKSATGLLAQTTTGLVPRGASGAIVTITITRATGQYNDGSVDDVSLVLNR
jgi:hypothetical protein